MDDVKKTNSNLELRKIPSLNFLYEINENGTIFRNVKSKKQHKIQLDFHHSKKGYYFVFPMVKGKTKRVAIHRAVAECWLGPCPKGMTVDHIDRDTHNNDYRNLRYATHSQQMKNRQLGRHVIEQATKNCLTWTLENVAKKVKAIKDGETHEFRSMIACAKFLAEIYPEKKAEHFRAKMKKRRKHIYDYDIIYA